ncbi:VOC family protein [Pyxidicoccus fallax]|uniref:VOC family protein n=1 Tax=Pyxidicoccus fallax TaxID=394095 RepID=A0A848LDG9_9BACT|nr:VOC family protein [Pyxidicoccus fallax]NMO16747.1 VOC family protein [Pyxidicoccus fallax]NPC77860.1 VOC family protein [Pyxidicoccus fallax]
MSQDSKPVGSVGWTDLTVKDAVALKDFYRDVVGWKAVGLDMGGYEDFLMIPPGSDAPAAGICHARGPNAELPPVWIVYITVEDLDRSLERVAALGGKALGKVRSAGPMGRYCVIEDPSGVVSALFESAKKQG